MTKTIFITGTSSGLGKLTACHFAKRGWNVAATMRTPETASDLTAYDNIKIFKLDVTDIQQVRVATERAIAAFGKVDVVVNNAGAGSYRPLEFAEERTIDWQFALNVRGPINVIRAFLPHFRANKGGMLINISSFMGVLTAMPTGSLYNMSKFALEGLTEGLYYELKPLNIELRLIEQGGSKGNNFLNSVVFNTHPAVRRAHGQGILCVTRPAPLHANAVEGRPEVRPSVLSRRRRRQDGPGLRHGRSDAVVAEVARLGDESTCLDEVLEDEHFRQPLLDRQFGNMCTKI